MSKKYLGTKNNSLESSVLGVWETAIEEGEAIRDAAQMTKEAEYKSQSDAGRTKASTWAGRQKRLSSTEKSALPRTSNQKAELKKLLS